MLIARCRGYAASERLPLFLRDSSRGRRGNRQAEQSIASRIFFGGFFFFFALASVEKALNLIGQRLPLLNALPNQVLQWVVVLLTFVIALLLRQIREELKKG